MVTALQMVVIIVSILLTWFLNADYQVSLFAKIMSESVILYMPVASWGIYLIAQDQGIINRYLTNKYLTRVGDASMYAFLIHYLVLQYTHIVISNLVSRNACSLIVCVIAMIETAGLTWIYIRGDHPKVCVNLLHGVE